MSKIQKIKNKIRICRNESKFSLPLGLLNLMIFGPFARGGHLEKRKQLLVCKKLKKRFPEFFGLDLDAIKDEPINKTIYVLWYQGFSDAPLIVQRCVQSIKSVYDDYEVVLLDKDNYLDYCSLPKEVIAKFEKGLIDKTHYSDIIRLALLTQNGGVWIDSTCLCLKKEDMRGYSFYSLKHKEGAFANASKGLWSTFYLASYKGHPLVKWVYEFLCAYWKRYDVNANYFTTDCIFRLAYDNYPEFKKLIDELPVNCEHCFSLNDALKMSVSEKEKMESLLNSNNTFKLTYKIDYSSCDGNTYYHRLINDEPLV